MMTSIGLKAKRSVDLRVIELHFAINELEADLSWMPNGWGVCNGRRGLRWGYFPLWLAKVLAYEIIASLASCNWYHLTERKRYCREPGLFAKVWLLEFFFFLIKNTLKQRIKYYRYGRGRKLSGIQKVLIDCIGLGKCWEPIYFAKKIK